MPFGEKPAATTDWQTPPEIIQALGGHDFFDLDPCGSASPGKKTKTAVTTFFLPKADGLLTDWRSAARDGRSAPRAYMNPPYQRGLIDLFMAKFVANDCGICLVFVRSDTEWMANALAKCSAVLFLAGRIRFLTSRGVRAKAGAAAPSCLMAFGPECAEALRNCGLPGNFFSSVDRVSVAKPAPPKAKKPKKKMARRQRPKLKAA